MIVVGVLLLIAGFSFQLPPFHPVLVGGWLLLVIGIVLAVLGRTGTKVGGRDHYY